MQLGGPGKTRSVPEECAGAPAILGTHHRPDHPFDRTMILFDRVVRIFDLPDPERGYPSGVHDFERGTVAPLAPMVTMSVRRCARSRARRSDGLPFCQAGRACSCSKNWLLATAHLAESRPMHSAIASGPCRSRRAAHPVALSFLPSRSSCVTIHSMPVERASATEPGGVARSLRKGYTAPV